MGSAPAIIESIPRASCKEAHPPLDTCEVTRLDTSSATAWGDYVATHSEGTLFHTLAWRNAVRDAFHHEDQYLLAIQGKRVVGVLPLFLVTSRLAGRMLVSVPYGVGGGILADDDGSAGQLFQAAQELALRERCRIIDLRSERAIVPNLPTIDRYVVFRRQLPETPQEVLGWLPRKARAAARNARDKYQLTVSFGDEHLPEVWRLYTGSMRRLGSLNYPFSFFQRLIDLTLGHHWVSTVQWNGHTVAGLITFLHKDRVMPYFIGTTDEAKRCSAANFAYLTAMERGVEFGYRIFDFGRSRRDNRGSYDFKRFQGFEPQPLGYQTWNAPGARSSDLSPSNPRFNIIRRAWTNMPLCVTRTLGAYISRHIPG
ncbi:MAG: FemAB family PEP-CTERM system-associated protein [Planctomycetes bacterium]|nr:FemAB family PEP-CTERM system-associated protein [Planctomycetota bacterium]